MDIQTNVSVLKPSDPISVITFLETCKTVCDSNSVHKCAAIRLIPHFVWELAKVTFSYPVTLDKRNHPLGGGRN